MEKTSAADPPPPKGELRNSELTGEEGGRFQEMPVLPGLGQLVTQGFEKSRNKSSSECRRPWRGLCVGPTGAGERVEAGRPGWRLL